MSLILDGRTAWSSLRRAAALVLAPARRIEPGERGGTTLAFCRECRRKVLIRAPKRFPFGKRRPDAPHVCPGCGSTLFLMS